ncbi:MAG TPA: 3-deoxy-7-phosphoheptulonate synthase [Gemmatimonadales bacterium]|jgi:3-deoxy-7-phosphoheptulonate synthase|nr:3-deoxy-7-phosphoheptulonate synthase [Gemmatimonadales bacterium]
MIIVLKPHATRQHAEELMQRIAALGLRPLYMPGQERVVLGALGDERALESLHLDSDPLVESVKPILAPYKLVGREMHPHDTIVDLGGTRVGGGRFTVIAGPCAVESREQMRATAGAVKQAGAHALRGGAYKPRTSPYSFQGLGREGLEILREVSRETGLPAVTEVVDAGDVELVEEYAAAFQSGARNMQNFRLLQALGKSRKPVILKRGMAAKVDDLLLAAEYILAEGNPNVILCERGITTFETATRNTLDLNAIPVIKQRSHLPILVDPSHGTGLRELVTPMAKAALACGADGILVEVHHDPPNALSDGRQSLFPEQFAAMMRELKTIAGAVGKVM